MRFTPIVVGGSSVDPSSALIWAGIAFILAGIVIAIVLLSKKHSQHKDRIVLLFFPGLGAGLILLGLLLDIQIA